MKYLDTFVGEYKKEYPIVKFSDDNVDLNSQISLDNSLQNNIWFKNFDNLGREQIKNRLIELEPFIPSIVDILRKSNVFSTIKSISIGGSFLFKECVGDIDFNIVTEGSLFKYFDYYNLEILRRYVNREMTKISFMIFGEDLFLKDCGDIDVIESKGFVHTNVAIREGLIFPYRNGIIFGNYFEKIDNIKPNLLVRIKRQLYQARLFLDNKIGCNCDNIYREHKATCRLTESAILLSEFFPNFPVKKEMIWEYENRCSNLGKEQLENLYRVITEFINLEQK